MGPSPFSVTTMITRIPKTVAMVFLWLYVLKRLCASFFNAERSREWKRVCFGAAVRYLVDHGFKTPSSIDAYMKWIKSVNMTPVVDELPDGANLLWIGPRRLDKVLFYCHGGAYQVGCTGTHMAFCRHLQLELEKRGIFVGVVILAYKLLPENPFPIPLREAREALQFLLAAGVLPENIVMSGDSAGGNLTLSLLSHILHRHPSVEPPFGLPHNARFRGLCLISPWVSMKSDSQCDLGAMRVRYKYDVISAKIGRPACETIVKDVPDSEIAFLDPLEGPENWFAGLDGLVGRVLISCGELECILQGIKKLHEKYLLPVHENIEFLEQENRLHIEPILDFAWKKDPGEKRIVEWFASTFSAAP
ncbi:alpha/beta-hydrolase [Guyanagaster necrorhizus]|uniref:Alpha/beta-hydrolase n=1 Tax=Guyanagaster necrorhizus TaxID=856835 RepID=A0A9P7VIZ5_9AGAR|nr:alpha/beta-hydrolase [Guyanagaster necrorhizus MCA 3950]KAG7441976.1 alpha/beta-hydrolase [Guyanagaster necrorhizus MCA 3950]